MVGNNIFYFGAAGSEDSSDLINSGSQLPISRQIPINKFQNIPVRNLDPGICLEFGAWNLGFTISAP